MGEDERRRPGVSADALGPPPADEGTYVIRLEEDVAGVETSWRGAGFLRGRKRADTYTVREEWPRELEDVELERVPAAEGDSGRVETLADGSISIPVYEEELVVTKRTVLKERVIVRKRTVTDRVTIEDELRRERVEIDADEGVDIVDER